MAEYKGDSHTLSVETKSYSGGRLGFAIRHPDGRISDSVHLSGVELCALRAQIDAYLSEASPEKISLKGGYGGRAYRCCIAPKDVLVAEWSDGSMRFKSSTPYIRLDIRTMALLRDQLNEHLGEALLAKVAVLSSNPEPLPVGTIVVGEGLTEAQKKKTLDPTIFANAVKYLSSFTWRDTVEGYAFWAAIRDRLARLQGLYIAEERRQQNEKKRQEEEEASKRTDVGAFSVITAGGSVVMHKNSINGPVMPPSEARDLAAALLKHADAAEKKT